MTALADAKAGTTPMSRLVGRVPGLTPGDWAVLRIWLISRVAVLALTWPAVAILQGSAKGTRPWLGLWNNWDAVLLEHIAQYGYFGPPGQEKIFKAYFSSCCGGITQSATDAFGDPYIPPLSDQNVQNLCNASPRFNWGPIVIAKSELTSEVNLPTQASCTQCHHSGPRGVANDCSSCHHYHNDPRAATAPLPVTAAAGAENPLRAMLAGPRR